MPTIESEKNETEEEEMDHEPAESDKSSDEDSESGSVDDDEISDLDEEEYDHRRTHCLDEMADLERQFSDIKEQCIALSVLMMLATLCPIHCRGV
ncbi:Hypothetical predicted protein [Mytilus galloprovincialis]|uniref:Uncharacterized protein n=1 Tax=Mytilus galloprovincialis TaxID=29158 RepID=A0A8B6EM36_MYTGA|nr:Hypothetical predicted protein [Mytilus galloprovincialis]